MDEQTTNDPIRHDDGGLRKARSRTERLARLVAGVGLPDPEQAFHVRQFIENVKIIDKRGHLVPLLMNRSQEIVFQKLMEQREKRLPARFICLKARQLGISTLVEAFIFALITRYPNRFSLVVAHSLESAAGIFAMAQRFRSHVRGTDSLPMARHNSRCIEYAAPHHSLMKIDTASNRNLGRGGTLHYVHVSEVAFWERPDEPVLAINQSVPQHWDTLVFWESTANGVHNLFHRTWVAAEKGEIDMEPIFLPWKEFPTYSLPVADREVVSLTEEEQRYKRRHDLTDGQIKWARYTRRNQCHNSWERFHQEYPASPELAFIHAGMPWFDQEVLAEYLERIAVAPKKRGLLEFSSGKPWTPVFVDHDDGPLQVWSLPDPTLDYSLGMDVGEGVGADYTVIQVLANDTGEIVAKYRSNRVRPGVAGVDAYLLGAWYNYGLLGIERNGPGLATLEVCEHGTADCPQMTHYPHLYYHTVMDRKIPEETKRLGWITNRMTKQAMLSRLARTMEARGLKIYSRETLLEMQGFVWDPEKKDFTQNYTPPNSSLAHDDEIIALAIANEMRTHAWENRFIKGKLPECGEF
ncbi:MAG: hypothetical protein AB1646_11925 [Thermodesulfobacteriota bacterium]